MANEFGIKITLPNKSENSSDPNDFTLHSSYNMWKVSSTGSGSVSVAGDGTESDVTITHNLGYNPYFIVYAKDRTTGRWHIGPVRFPRNDGTVIERVCVGFTYTDVNTITLSFYRTFDSIFAGNPTETVDYKYYLFLEAELAPWTS